MRDRINFTTDYGTKTNTSIIKVIGVGGGGGNAVEHMYSEGIVGVDFLVCNTDQMSLNKNLVPSKLVLGESGLGAGAKPEVACELAEASTTKIKEFIGNETKMLFITAGMGKGTGTGAAPIVAKIAREMGILTVGVVTFPFKFEGSTRADVATKGIDEMKKYVDSLIVVKNQNLMKYYTDLDIDDAYGCADDVLKNAVKCIAELITTDAKQKVDYNDIKTIMQNSGQAMLGLAEASGTNRIEKVVEEALSCPLLNEDVIVQAQNFLFFISYGPESKLTMAELEELTEKFESLKSSTSDVIWGRAKDQTLGDKIRLSVIITNYEHKKEVKPTTVTVPGAETQQEKATTAWNEMQSTPDTVTHPVEEPVMAQLQHEDVDLFDFSSERAKTQRKIANSFMQQNPAQPSANTASEQYHPVEMPIDDSCDFIQTNMPHTTRISQARDLRYEDNDMFNRLINTPAIVRESQNNNFDEQYNFQNSFDLDNDMSAFYKDIPD